ncbi:MAG: hypothetical protein VX642_06025 [Bdellovibrionota bacterium]|nr:hypothetical protein [Bdellovibrionota bacterium]
MLSGIRFIEPKVKIQRLILSLLITLTAPIAFSAEELSPDQIYPKNKYQRVDTYYLGDVFTRYIDKSNGKIAGQAINGGIVESYSELLDYETPDFLESFLKSLPENIDLQSANLFLNAPNSNARSDSNLQYAMLNSTTYQKLALSSMKLPSASVKIDGNSKWAFQRLNYNFLKIINSSLDESFDGLNLSTNFKLSVEALVNVNSPYLKQILLHSLLIKFSERLGDYPESFYFAIGSFFYELGYQPTAIGIINPGHCETFNYIPSSVGICRERQTHLYHSQNLVDSDFFDQNQRVKYPSKDLKNYLKNIKALYSGLEINPSEVYCVDRGKLDSYPESQTSSLPTNKIFISKVPMNLDGTDNVMSFTYLSLEDFSKELIFPYQERSYKISYKGIHFLISQSEKYEIENISMTNSFKKVPLKSGLFNTKPNEKKNIIYEQERIVLKLGLVSCFENYRDTQKELASILGIKSQEATKEPSK